MLFLWVCSAASQVSAADSLGRGPAIGIAITSTVYLPLIMKSGGALPSVTCFDANPATVAPGGPSVLSWCVTNALSVTIGPAPGLVTGASTVITTLATTEYVLSAFNPAGVTTRTTTISVTGGTPCGNIGALQAWEGTLGFSYGRSVSNVDEALSLQRGGNVSFHIEQSGSGPGGVSWIGFATGNVNINDRHDFYTPPPPQVGTLIGSSAPITLVQGIEEHSRVALNVRYSDCSYNFTFDPYVEATETDSNTPPFQIETTVGSLKSSYRPLMFGSLNGDGFWSAHTLTWLDDGSDVYFPPWPTPGGLFPTESSLGSAHVNWRFDHAP